MARDAADPSLPPSLCRLCRAFCLRALSWLALLACLLACLSPSLAFVAHCRQVKKRRTGLAASPPSDLGDTKPGHYCLALACLVPMTALVTDLELISHRLESKLDRPKRADRTTRTHGHALCGFKTAMIPCGLHSPARSEAGYEGLAALNLAL